ncbi:hypothetical protein ACTL6P_02375 [Endozoicomonas acroporae]|uniref:hypothetical protein n=1 Tax=Endozoicomonas acroporae TaxID=1701104 RepID=UPI0015E10E2A|nr:hypothetical protein [Endozoicomonas acroporae]
MTEVVVFFLNFRSVDVFEDISKHKTVMRLREQVEDIGRKQLVLVKFYRGIFK